MATSHKGTDYIRQGRENRLIRERVHDSYMSKRKLPQGTTCPECNAVVHQGRWVWGEARADAETEMCPACRRVQDKVPAGFLSLTGDFLNDHKDEVLSLVKNLEKREKAEHPLKRIIGIEEGTEGLLLTFTDAHLARAAGEGVHHAYEGELDFTYTDEETTLRVTWSR